MDKLGYVEKGLSKSRQNKLDQEIQVNSEQSSSYKIDEDNKLK